ncbi:MAG: DUF1801 domain-containing protein [Sporichthyaceae bacterium]|nr:DUF1801 domain-containing protein [Sporichthyaceae bacterium]
MSADAERLLTGCPTEVRPLARKAYQQLRAAFPDAVITADTENIGFGTDAGYQGLKFTLTPRRNYVTLGIARAAGLPDPTGLLEGSGKVHRHVKLRTQEDLDNPALAALIDAALAD